MPKVGIMSMQRIANYGSFLQAYGLKNILEELGCDVEFVDYHPGKTLIPADGGTGIRRKIAKLAEALMFDAPFKEKIKFIKYKKNYSKKYYPYLRINSEMNYIPELDLLIIGSDEVFNCVQNNTNVGFSPELFGEGNRAKKLISYAGSFGNTTIEKLEMYCVKEKVAGYIKKFDAVSVRDINSGRIIKALTGKEPVYNLDPVLVYDFVGKCKYIPNTVAETNYMILYGYAGRFSKEECKKIREYADNKGLKIFCIGGVQDACDKFIDCNPFEVISYFQHANCIVTDTFHGTILSVITQRPFVSVVRSSGYGNSEKLTDLLGRLELKGRIADSISEITTILSEDIVYEDVEKLIADERRKSYAYLESQIRKVK